MMILLTSLLFNSTDIYRIVIILIVFLFSIITIYVTYNLDKTTKNNNKDNNSNEAFKNLREIVKNELATPTDVIIYKIDKNNNNDDDEEDDDEPFCRKRAVPLKKYPPKQGDKEEL